MQSKLINSIVELIEQYEEKGMELKFILETHSETIVNYIGYLIATGKLSHDSVNVYIFEKKNGKSVIRKSKYDEDGALINWPMGFFFPDDD
jgi:predicted ATPase